MRACSRPRGFTLPEVLVALSILIAVSAGVAGLFGVAVTTGRASRDQTVAVSLATGKLEQLRSLEWRYEIGPGGVRVSRTDLQSDLSVEPIGHAGPGLAESPSGTLDDNRPPYVDYLSRFGAWLGTGRVPPPQAIYIRRWAIRRLPGAPDESLALQVLVTTVAREQARPPGAHAWNGQDVLLATLMTRRVR